MKPVPTGNMAAYLRRIAIDGYIIQVDHTDIKAAMKRQILSLAIPSRKHWIRETI